MPTVPQDVAWQVTVRRDIAKVLGYCRRWGVSVIKGDNPFMDDDKSFHHGPTGSTAIYWPRREIIWHERRTESDAPNLILHELAHCLAETKPSDVDEVYGMMLSFEYHSHRWLRVNGWEVWMADYEAGDAWRYLSQQERHRILQESRKAAISAGVLSPELKPTFQRPVWLENGT